MQMNKWMNKLINQLVKKEIKFFFRINKANAYHHLLYVIT